MSSSLHHDNVEAALTFFGVPAHGRGTGIHKVCNTKLFISLLLFLKMIYPA
jgi:hypothetical protein